MDESRIQQALRQGPPFRTRYVPQPLPLGPEIVGPSVASAGVRFVALVVLTILIVVAGLVTLTVGGFLPPPMPDVSPLPRADHDAGAWTEVAALTNGRIRHSATLLLDGDVLVVGGSTTLNGEGASGAEMYERATKTWVAVSPTIGVHSDHTATRLGDGTLLVAGGGDLPFAEIYDPGIGSWTATGGMAAILTGHTATLLPGGSVLVAGGRPSVAAAELYDPATGSWHSTGRMAEGRFGHTATLLLDGRVLVVGGIGASGELASAELYDPSSGTWSAAAALPRSVFGHTATRLLDGTVLVVGGWHRDTSQIESSAHVYNPIDDTWVSAAGMLEARGGHSATLLADGSVLVAGGFSNGQQACGHVLATAEVFVAVRGTWSAARPMGTVRYSHVATLLTDGSVLVTGGTDTGCMDDPLASVELFGPSTR